MSTNEHTYNTIIVIKKLTTYVEVNKNYKRMSAIGVWFCYLGIHALDV